MSARNRHHVTQVAQEVSAQSEESEVVSEAEVTAPEGVSKVEAVIETLAPEITEASASESVSDPEVMQDAPVAEPASAPAMDVQAAPLQITLSPTPNTGIIAINLSETAAIMAAEQTRAMTERFDRQPDGILLVGDDNQKTLQAVATLVGNGEASTRVTTKLKTQAASVLCQMKANKALFGKPENGARWPSFDAFRREYASWFDNPAPYLKHWEGISRLDGTEGIVGHMDNQGNVYSVMQSILIRWNVTGCDKWAKLESAVDAVDTKKFAFDAKTLGIAFETALRGGAVKGAGEKTVSFSSCQWNKASELNDRVLDVANLLYPPTPTEPVAQTLTDSKGNPILTQTGASTPNPQTTSATGTTTTTTGSEPPTPTAPSPVKSMGGKIAFRVPESGAAQWDAEIDPQAIRDADMAALAATRASIEHAARVYTECLIFTGKVKDKLESRLTALVEAKCLDSVVECLNAIEPLIGKTAYYAKLTEAYLPKPTVATPTA